MSNGCAYYEKCGDVIVSPKNNMIGLCCNFCSHIFENLVEFLHHLQWMHNDVLAFTKPYNVYNLEQLLPKTDAAEESDSGIPSITSSELEPETKSGQARNKNILDALAAYDVDYKKGMECVMQCQAEEKCSTVTKDRDVVAEVVAMLLKDEENVEAAQPQLEDNADDGLELQQLLQAAGLQSIEVHNEQAQSTNYLNDEPQTKDTTETQFKPTNQEVAPNLKRVRHRWEMAAKIKTEKPQSICDLKSYAIARSACSRVQQQRMSNIKKRILRSLENEPRKPIDRVYLDKISAEMKMVLPDGNVHLTGKNSIIQKMHLASNMKSETNQFNKVKSITEEGITKEKLSKDAKATPATKMLFKAENKVAIMNTQKKPSSSIDLSAAKPKSVTEIEKNEINMITDCNMVSTSQKITLPSLIQPKKADFSPAKTIPSHNMVENVMDNKTSIAKRYPKSSIIISKAEILPRLRENLKSRQTEMKVETNQSKDNVQRVRRSMLTKKPTRRPSFNQVIFKGEPMKSELETEPCPKQTNKRKGATINNNSYASIEAVEKKRTKAEQNSLNFDLSDSVVAFLQSDLETTQLDADSLWELAETSEKRNSDCFESLLNEVKGEQKCDSIAAPTNVAIENETEAAPNNNLRADFNL